MRLKRLGLGVGIVFLVGSVLLFSILTTGITSIDGDSVPAFEEWKGNSSPFDSDSDDDGLKDGRELALGTDTFTADTDQDGLTDQRELNGPTNPTAKDTDEDNLPDGEEFRHKTDPKNNDTDGDRYWDGSEVNEGLDPLAADTDGDGINDLAEVRGEYETAPAKADTDGDELNDEREINAATHPLLTDSDSDHLDDGVEITQYGTNATRGDTDGDGLPDGAEIKKTGILPNADPLHKDLYIELDYMRDYTLPDDGLATIKQRFAAAPVSNPDGNSGIRLHVVRDDQVPYVSVLSDEQSNEYRERFYDWKSKGYLQVILIDRTTATTYENEATQGAGGSTPILVTGKASSQRISFVFMHELGHTLGLMPEDFRGIDSRKIPYADYPSVMNYNSPQTKLEYSDGSNSQSDFDDWQHIADALRVTYGLEYDWETNTTEARFSVDWRNQEH